jgi:DNA (cytosine-5)-methyltransferase 1
MLREIVKVKHQFRLLDLYCGAGGAAMGYHRAGFDITGVDIKPQPYYPFKFTCRDVIRLPINWLQQFDVVHASPTCQMFSDMKHAPGAKVHSDLITPTRRLLREAGVLYVIENVEGAPLLHPVVLCGSQFDLKAGKWQLRRHRLFEANFPIPQLKCQHRSPTIGVYGGHVRCRSKEFWRETAADFPGQDKKKLAMESLGFFSECSFEALSQVVPPAYTEHVGLAAKQYIEGLK